MKRETNEQRDWIFISTIILIIQEERSQGSPAITSSQTGGLSPNMSLKLCAVSELFGVEGKSFHIFRVLVFDFHWQWFNSIHQLLSGFHLEVQLKHLLGYVGCMVNCSSLLENLRKDPVASAEELVIVIPVLNFETCNWPTRLPVVDASYTHSPGDHNIDFAVRFTQRSQLWNILLSFVLVFLFWIEDIVPFWFDPIILFLYFVHLIHVLEE